MKIFAISDLHLSVNNPKPMDIFGQVWENYLESIEESWGSVSGNDIVLLPGDLSWAMKLEDAASDLEYIGKLNGRKVILRGNHDYWWKSISAVRAALPAGCFAVQNDALKFDNIIVCGSRLWTTPEPGKPQADEDKKIYERESLRLKLSLDSAKKMREEGDKLVIMTHYPPFNSKLLPSIMTDIIAEYSPDAVVYGHLHGSSSRCEKVIDIGGVKYYLASCDLVGNKLIELPL